MPSSWSLLSLSLFTVVVVVVDVVVVIVVIVGVVVVVVGPVDMFRPAVWYVMSET